MEHGELLGVVALDGPSGTGKSTVARRLAGSLGAAYLDTGAMYRAATLAVLRAQVDPTDAAAVTEVVQRARIGLSTDPGAQATTVDGADVSAEIRGQEVTTAVSPVSAVPQVRAQLVAEQRRIITEALDTVGGIVVEGRDIGTTVAPDAALKVYLTASAEARAQRRSRQDSTDLSATLASVQRRDAYDSSRATSPLRPAEDAVELDTTELDLAGVQAELLAMVSERDMLKVPTGSGRER
ncbi:(d)CMP kinase [Kutzneria viridogrisea]|uniref:Cytidylate kinase n=2 Tax=Kutzneria TaxID=43356 RepID=W5W655_9PSEU|nr:(d)CMP kinase [Kutzneria albida]AHH96240.1 Cytidylate kinase [Kutzneria albida DSM 43870]MBA8928547.1 cytidylate kinase [Kutzneria viridogrisea]